MDAFFQGGDKPTGVEKRAAEKHLRQVVARSRVQTKGRKYYSIDRDGVAKVLEPPPDRLSESKLSDVRDSLTIPPASFEAWYLRRRMELASCTGAERTFVPNKLRRALSTLTEAKASLDNQRRGPPSSPKTDSLIKWARRQFVDDLRRFLKDGSPRKTLVFSSFIGKAPQELRRRLTHAIEEAWRTVAASRDWKKIAARATIGLERVQRQVESRLAHPNLAQALRKSNQGQRLAENFRTLIASLLKQKKPTLITDLFGHDHFAALVAEDMERRLPY